jgi:hypothetical protein
VNKRYVVEIQIEAYAPNVDRALRNAIISLGKVIFQDPLDGMCITALVQEIDADGCPSTEAAMQCILAEGMMEDGSTN